MLAWVSYTMTPWHPHVTLIGELNYPTQHSLIQSTPRKVQTIILCDLYIGSSIDDMQYYINTITTWSYITKNIVKTHHLYNITIRISIYIMWSKSSIKSIHKFILNNNNKTTLPFGNISIIQCQKLINRIKYLKH